MLSEFIAATWEEVNRPCSRRAVDQALALAETREAAFDSKAAVLVHGDGHSANTLQGTGHAPSPPRFKLVDPDGLLAEPAYDLAIPMREWNRELLDGDAARDSAVSSAPTSAPKPPDQRGHSRDLGVGLRRAGVHRAPGATGERRPIRERNARRCPGLGDGVRPADIS